MNQQRRTIYKLRRRVLAAGAGVALVEYDENPKTKVKVRSEHTVSWEDFREMLLDALEDVVLAQTGAYAPAGNPDTWDLQSLNRAVKDNLNLEMGFQNQGSREELQEQIYQAAEKVLRAREEEFGDDFRVFVRNRYLATIDQLWKDHLLAMDHLRQGIGLRAYGQRDPKQAYKKEGYDGFMQMLGAINHQLMSQLMRVQGRAQAEESGEAAAADAGPRAPVPGEPRRWGRAAGEAGGQGSGEGRPKGRTQRPVPVRQRQEVQEVPRPPGRVAAAAPARPSEEPIRDPGTDPDRGAGEGRCARHHVFRRVTHGGRSAA